MIIPKQEAVYQNLNTSFTNFSELLVDLKENSFTGCVQVSFWEYEGILLLDTGNIINAQEEINGNLISGQDAVKKVIAKAKDDDGAISVYALKGEMVTMLASVVKSVIIYENLSTDFTSLEALISKLQTEDHTGYVEVNFQESQQKGHIFLLAGRVIDTLLSTRGEEISGSNVLPRVIDLASSMGATFNVYKAAIEEALSESEIIRVSIELPQLLEIWGAIIGAVEAVSDDLLTDGVFLNTFKDTLVSIANDYPFLDPFAAKFSYQDGTVSFSGEAKMDFSQGIGDGLNGTVEILAEQAALEGKDLFAPLRTALERVKTEYKDQFEQHNFRVILRDLI
ncbi:MAG: hypothetical protein GQ562_06900 [Anaerolineales bacterium]|nr:hypothetical protein [Anaerolineales bacterium]